MKEAGALGRQIKILRSKNNMTQGQMANNLNVTAQAVSSWERGDTMPDIPKIIEIAHLFDVTTDYLLGNYDENNFGTDVSFNDEKKMFTYLKAYANSKNMYETLKALQFAREEHKNQKRKEGRAYIIHPLSMACNALAMGIEKDTIIATILLHDVCEDCNVTIDELPVNDYVKENVDILTYRISTGEIEKTAKKDIMIEL